MKDRLFCLIIGLLIGLVVMQWIMPLGHASDIVQGSAILHIQGGFALDINGQVWLLWNNNGCWQPQPEYDVPIPAEQIKLWILYWFITLNDELWRFDKDSEEWQNCGTWPGTVPAEQSNWGEIKGEYKGDNQ